MCDKKIKIRPASNIDRDEIYAWRNDPVSRSMSFNNSIVLYEEHRNWFENSLINVNRKLYIGEVAGSKIGICRFDLNATDSSVEVSINMNPTSRGCGFGKKFLASCVELYLKDNQHNLLAKIKPDNIASLKIFKSSGFKPISSNADMITLRKSEQRKRK